MKKILLIVIISVLMILTSCNLSGSADQFLSLEKFTSVDETSEISGETPDTSQYNFVEIPSEKSFKFTTHEINEKYYNDSGSYAELELELPELTGNYDGIPQINEFFANKKEFFAKQVPVDMLNDFEDWKMEGKKDNFFRSASYRLDAILGDIISIPAWLDGGAGGVGWEGVEGNVFDLNTGKRLNLSDIFKGIEQAYMDFIFDSVSKEIADNLRNGWEYFFDDAYSDDGQSMIRDWNPDDFYFTPNALVIFYQKYALTVGAGGPQAFEVPFENIKDMLAININ